MKERDPQSSAIPFPRPDVARLIYLLSQCRPAFVEALIEEIQSDPACFAPAHGPLGRDTIGRERNEMNRGDQAKCQVTQMASSLPSGTKRAKSPRETEQSLRRFVTEKRSEIRRGILLFRFGDFYGACYEDAETVARILGIPIETRRSTAGTLSLAKIPVEQAATIFRKLQDAGYRLGVVEDVEDGKGARRSYVSCLSPNASSTAPVTAPGRRRQLCEAEPGPFKSPA